jgi:hypothetical protein
MVEAAPCPPLARAHTYIPQPAVSYFRYIHARTEYTQRGQVS